MAIRIKVDRALCQGHGVCESEAPEVFEVGKDNQVIVIEETLGDAHRGGVDQAVKYCPTHALSTVED